MFNFKAAVQIKDKQPSMYIAIYKDGQWFVKSSGNLIPIQVPDNNTSTVFYSTPENPAHEAWTKRTITKGGFTSDNRWWTTLYNGMKLNGRVKDNLFIISKIYHKDG